MTWIIGDIESDGPVPGPYSMVSFGLVVLDEKLDKTFYGKTAPISQHWKPDALAISGFTRAEHETFPHPSDTMHATVKWLAENVEGRPIFVSDNPGFDFAFLNYYFHTYTGDNPFGWSSRRIGDMYSGLVKNVRKPWKHLRKTKHTHHPVDDAIGNAEALLEMKKMGLNVPV